MEILPLLLFAFAALVVVFVWSPVSAFGSLISDPLQSYMFSAIPLALLVGFWVKYQS